MNKSQFVNDPVHGFVTIPKGLVGRVVASDMFQRLRRIRQLGLSDLVYPGATHSRFGHSLGARGTRLREKMRRPRWWRY